jgi:WD40 repeat protein
MKPTPRSNDDSLPVAVALRVDAVCLRFEAAWQLAGERPVIEGFLISPTEPGYRHLLRELVRIEAHYRRQKGETPRPQDYQKRFDAFDPAWLTGVRRSRRSTIAAANIPQVSTPAGTPTIPGYEVLGELGRGGMGIVYKARQVGLSRLVALKVVLAGAHAGADELARFRREAEAIARLHHPNVIEIYQLGESDGVPFFSMEFCAGGSLARKLAGRPLSPRKAAGLVERLARGVQAAHAVGVIHRDLKPANVLLTEDGIPKITDFGLARKVEGSTALTASGAIVGTPSYMAPEQAAGEGKHVGPAADVYGLGAILYECLTGRPPFHAATAVDTLVQVLDSPPVAPSQLRPRVPARLEAICLRCLAKRPAQRFGSAAQLADELRRFLDGLPSEVQPRDGRSRLNTKIKVGCLLNIVIPLLMGGGFWGLFFLLLSAGAPPAHWPILLACCAAAIPLGFIIMLLCIRASRGPGNVRRLAFSPDGCTVASVGREWGHLVGDLLKLWDVAGERLRLSWKTDGADVQALSFTADGQTLLTLDSNGVGGVWDVADGHPRARFCLGIDELGAVAFGPDGRTLATVTGTGSDQTLTLWDIDLAGAVSVSARQVVPFKVRNPGQPLIMLVFAADGRTLAAQGGAPGSSVQLWDICPGGLRPRLLSNPRGQFLLALSADGRALALLNPKSKRHLEISVWDVPGDRACCTIPVNTTLKHLAISPDGPILATLGFNVRLWDARTGRQLAQLDLGGTLADRLAFSPDGRLLAVGDSDGEVSWHDVEAARRAERQFLTGGKS